MVKTQSVCTMEYDPHFCSFTIGEKNYQEQGSNLCKAKLQILQALCQENIQVQEKDYAK